jgi:hypothetical protein
MPRIRFSMWWVMVFITVACVFLFLAVTYGDFIGMAMSSLVWCILPTPLVIFVVYGRGDLQAFAIGALVPWATLIIRVSGSFSLLGITFWLLPLCAICGFVAVMTRRWLQAR